MENQKMISINNYILEQLKKYGLVSMLLLGAIYYLSARLDKVELDNKACREMLLEVYKTDHEALLQALERNTKALEQINDK